MFVNFQGSFFPASQAKNMKGEWVNRDVNKQTQNEKKEEGPCAQKLWLNCDDYFPFNFQLFKVIFFQVKLSSNQNKYFVFVGARQSDS